MSRAIWAKAARFEQDWRTVIILTLLIIMIIEAAWILLLDIKGDEWKFTWPGLLIRSL